MISLFNFLKKFHYGARLQPDQDWLALLAVMFALLVISVVWNLWFYDAVKAGAALANLQAPLSTLSSNERELSAIQSTLTMRAQEEASYETGGVTFVDPSGQ